MLSPSPTSLHVPYDRNQISCGIVHLGVGNFHRAHQAVFANRMLAAGHKDWAICGINLYMPDLSHDHAEQDGLYTVLARDQYQSAITTVGSIKQFLYGSNDTSLNRLCDPSVKMVSLTITEKGYCHTPGTSTLDMSCSIAQDIKSPLTPVTAIGFLAEALRRRQAFGLPGLTVASCDNIPENGALLQAVLLEYVYKTNAQLADWIQANVTFPISMVDRIVPAVAPSTAEAIRHAAGFNDALGVMCEPFMQWVIEDRFAHDTVPPLAGVGVTITKDTRPFEHMKHRMLNGAQTALTHIGALAGHETTADAANDDQLATFIDQFLRLQACSVVAPEGEDLEAYRRTTLARLQNIHIRHKLSQIATDASFKIRQRILDPLVELSALGQETRHHAFAAACWIQHMRGSDSQGQTMAYSDPYRSLYSTIHEKYCGSVQDLCIHFMQLPVFPEALRDNASVRIQLIEALTLLARLPAKAAMKQFLA